MKQREVRKLKMEAKQDSKRAKSEKQNKGEIKRKRKDRH